MAKKPPTVKKPALFDMIIRELTEAESDFERSPKCRSEYAADNFRVASIRRKYFELKATVKAFETLFSEEVYVDDEQESKWDSKLWTKKPALQKVLVRAKQLIPILDYLSSIMSQYRTDELQKRIKEADDWYRSLENSKGEKVDRELALFCFEDDNYDQLTDILRCSEITIRKYLSAMEKVGIILRVSGGSGGGETRTSTIYAFGYWRHVRSEKYEGPKFEPFLTKKTSGMLLGFSLRNPKQIITL